MLALISKLVIMSLLIASVAVPLVYAREKSRSRGFRKLVRWFAVFCFIYMLALVYVYPRLEAAG